MIGAHVARMLQSFDVNVLAYTSSEEKAARLGAKRCSLEEIFCRADVVSLHTPWLKETEGMITGQHFAAMKSNAVFINLPEGRLCGRGR